MKQAKAVVTNLCRLLIAATFILSGYVKGIDPLGTQYKLQDYLTAMHLGDLIPNWATLTGAVLLAAMEFTLGVMVLFAIQRRIVSKLMLAVMTVMTGLTVWIYAANPVTDCGCFGDAVTLSNGQTLAKNIVLLACAAAMARWPLAMPRLISKTNQWIVVNFTIIYIFATSTLCLYKLPVFDFRPYHIGADIRKGMEIPEGAEQPEFNTTFIMKKNGVTKEFSLENYPDSTWEFVDSKTVQTKKGYEPPIHDFSLTLTDTGEDITSEVVEDKGYTFLLVAPHIEDADDSNFGDINQVYEYAQEHHTPFYCLTASTNKAIERWRDITGAEYPFCNTDETTLKTIIRSNPGLVLIKDGIVIRKWSHNELPQLTDESPALDKIPEGSMPEITVGQKILYTLLWFFMPLMLLSLADRIWAWTKWVRKNKEDETPQSPDPSEQSGQSETSEGSEGSEGSGMSGQSPNNK